MTQNPAVTRLACYMSNASMAAVASISPLLFITFHDLYGISFTLLGLLVLVCWLRLLRLSRSDSLRKRRFEGLNGSL